MLSLTRWRSSTNAQSRSRFVHTVNQFLWVILLLTCLSWRIGRFFVCYICFDVKMSKMNSKDKDKTLHDKLKQFFRINKGEYKFGYTSRDRYTLRVKYLFFFVTSRLAFKEITKIVKMSLWLTISRRTSALTVPCIIVRKRSRSFAMRFSINSGKMYVLLREAVDFAHVCNLRSCWYREQRNVCGIWFKIY